MKVPVWTCGVENAVCCHGYVTITKIPGGLAEVGENNCIGNILTDILGTF